MPTAYCGLSISTPVSFNCAQCNERAENIFMVALQLRTDNLITGESERYSICEKCKDEFDTALEQFITGWIKHKKMTPDKGQV